MKHPAFRLITSLVLLAFFINSASAFFFSTRDRLTLDLDDPVTLQMEADHKYVIGIRGLPDTSFQAYIKPASGELRRELVVDNLVKQVKSTTVDFDITTSAVLSKEQVAGSLELVVYQNYYGGKISKQSYSIPITLTK